MDVFQAKSAQALKSSARSLRFCAKLIFAVLPIVLATSAFPSDRVFVSYASAKPILEDQAEHLPPELKNVSEAKWNAWTRQQDKAIRARLQEGDLDSMVNLLLLGTSFTTQPRIQMEKLTEASKSGVFRARVDDLVLGLSNPGGNERLVFLQQLVRKQGIDLGSSDGAREAGVFVLNNVLRVAQERRAIADRAAKANPTSLLDRTSLFDDRGVSLDTSILPDFSIDRTLMDLKQRGVLRPGQVARVAVIGPGLDFIDKNSESAFDFYPQQTVQPFALYDSLVRLGLRKSSGTSLSVFDISSRVMDHMRRARDRATRNDGYVIQLPRDVTRVWAPELAAYWSSLGEQVGVAIPPIPPPSIFPGLKTRAVRVRSEVVLNCQPVDLNIVLERLNLPATDRFDLMIATNLFVYYDAFEQSLALENAGAMLKPGGLLLTNDHLPEVPGGPMRLAGTTVVQFDPKDPSSRDAVGWYQRQ